MQGCDVLTVAARNDFIVCGEMIRIVDEETRARLTVDAGAPWRARWKAASKLPAQSESVKETTWSAHF